jgi:hypothetical protein
MVNTERFGQSCASAAGASVISTAHVKTPHAVRNDIGSSLTIEALIDFVGHVGLRGRMLRSRPALRFRQHDAPNQAMQATIAAHLRARVAR